MNDETKTYPYKVLVVDDMPTIREILKRFLLEIGFEYVDTAENAQKTNEMLGIEAGLEDPYELIFLDINLPDKSGIEVLKEVRENSVYKDVPVVMVSTENEQGTVVKALKQGATNYILKPFDKNILKRKVEEVFSKKE